MMLNQLVKEFNRLAKAANLRRSVIIHDDPKFEGEWIAIPKEDFDALRKVLESFRKQKPRREDGKER